MLSTDSRSLSTSKMLATSLVVSLLNENSKNEPSELALSTLLLRLLQLGLESSNLKLDTRDEFDDDGESKSKNVSSRFEGCGLVSEGGGGIME